VSDAGGVREFHEAPHSPLSSFFGVLASDGTRPIMVATVSLDAAFAPGSRVDFIKIDAEGAEPLVYRGMARVVADNPELDIVMEWSRSHFERAGFAPEEFFDQLGHDGFRGALIDERGSGAPQPASREQAPTLEGANLYFTRRHAN
jgi:hypothetical protein